MSDLIKRARKLDGGTGSLVDQLADEIEQQKQELIEAETRILNLTEGMLKLVEESNQPVTTVGSDNDT